MQVIHHNHKLKGIFLMPLLADKKPRSSAPGPGTPTPPRTPPVELSFNADERALLDLLHAKADADGAVPLSDTQLIQQLALPTPERFFAAKMRLVAAGALSLHVGVEGHALCRLEMPERPNPRSARYILFVLPWECRVEVGQLVRRFRLNKAQEKANELRLMNALPPGPNATAKPSSRPRTHYNERSLERALPRLGVQRIATPSVVPGPLRPPMGKTK
jgi:hypothetical protein